MNCAGKMAKISVIIDRWRNTLCPDCGAPMKIVMGYFRRCSEHPDEHMLCDGEFYLKKIKEVIKKCLI